MKSVANLLVGYCDGHSHWQIDHFIVGMTGYGHPWGMFQQTLRELRPRETQLQELRAKLRHLTCVIEALSLIKLRHRIPWFDRRRLLKLRQANVVLVGLEKSIDELAYEHGRFHEHADKLSKLFGEITPLKREAYERGWWEHKVKCMAAIDLLTTGRVGSNVLEMAASFPMELREKLLSAIAPPLPDDKGVLDFTNQRELIDWFQRRVNCLEENNANQTNCLPAAL